VTDWLPRNVDLGNGHSAVVELVGGNVRLLLGSGRTTYVAIIGPEEGRDLARALTAAGEELDEESSPGLQG
jgi:hypothetical protein